jgi:hypothetical protein
MGASVYDLRFCDASEHRTALGVRAGQATVAELTIADGVQADVVIYDANDQVIPSHVVQLPDGLRVTFTPTADGTAVLAATPTTDVGTGVQYDLAIGITGPPPSPQLAVTEVLPGGTMLFGVHKAPPGARVYFAASRAEGVWCAPGANAMCMDLTSPILLGQAEVAADGTVVVPVGVPPAVPPGLLHFQALVVGSQGVQTTTVVSQ